jgi:anti-sigma regulatory factor (Ser/Thr protein kinase)
VRTGAAAGREGNFHELVLYDSDEELLATVVPFLREGLAAGEPAVVAWDETRAALLRAAMPDADEVVFLDGGQAYARPTRAISAFREMLAGYAAAGAGQVRIAGELATHPSTWDWWARYESAGTQAYGDFPVWFLCSYDTRTTPGPAREDALRAHPYRVGTGGQHLPNERYVPAAEFRAHSAVSTDPLQATAPLIELVNEPLATARRAIRDAEAAGQLPPTVDTGALVLVGNEALTNGIFHGELPVRVRLWAGPDRVVAAVSDRGPGPSDPAAGLLPATHALTAEPGRHSHAGQGLWLIHEFADHVSFAATPDGYTLCATLGTPAGTLA